MAEVKVFASQCPIGGVIIHFGATSMDIKDNAEVLQIKESLEWITKQIRPVLGFLAEWVEKTAETPCIAFTHLQPAEPTTYGYRFANHAQDLIEDYENLLSIASTLKGKGFKGAVGNAASYIETLGSIKRFEEFEADLSSRIGVPFYPIATQTYPRKQDYQILSALSSLAGTLYKLAFDIRLLQSQMIGELSEPFGQNQVGSSAMPFKRNPIHSEKIDSLARMISTLPLTAWNNYAHSLLERTLDDSANRRTILPEAFLGTDELLATTQKILAGLTLNRATIQHNLERFAPFAGTERLLMELVKHGADRQEMHELIRHASMKTWQDLEAGKPNQLLQELAGSSHILRFLTAEEVESCMKVDNYLGIATTRSLELAARIRKLLQ
jgi:adenylosuccinate lyase